MKKRKLKTTYKIVFIIVVRERELHLKMIGKLLFYGLFQMLIFIIALIIKQFYKSHFSINFLLCRMFHMELQSNYQPQLSGISLRILSQSLCGRCGLTPDNYFFQRGFLAGRPARRG